MFHRYNGWAGLRLGGVGRLLRKNRHERNNASVNGYQRILNLRLLHNFDHHMREVVRGASIAFVLKVAAVGIGFGVNVVLARSLGAESTGLFFLCSNRLRMLNVFCSSEWRAL